MRNGEPYSNTWYVSACEKEREKMVGSMLQVSYRPPAVLERVVPVQSRV